MCKASSLVRCLVCSCLVLPVGTEAVLLTERFNAESVALEEVEEVKVSMVDHGIEKSFPNGV